MFVAPQDPGPLAGAAAVATKAIEAAVWVSAAARHADAVADAVLPVRPDAASALAWAELTGLQRVSCDWRTGIERGVRLDGARDGRGCHGEK